MKLLPGPARILLAGLLAAGVSNAVTVAVGDFGAAGDGTTDDTGAFRQALTACAEAGGGIVRVPAGRYRIEAYLDIPDSVTLEGEWRAPHTVSAYHDPAAPGTGTARPPRLDGTVLLAVADAGNPDGHPFITLGWNATLKGVTVFYPDQTKTNPPVAYPWCVANSLKGADNCSIVDVLLVNPYLGVDFGTRASGRHYIRNLYGEPLLTGLKIGSCLDVGRVENVHLWPFWTAADGQENPIQAFRMEKGTAFLIGRTDWEQMTNCFCISYNVGFRFTTGEYSSGPMVGPGNVQVTGGGADHCNTAILVEGGQSHAGHSFTNCQVYGDIVVAPTNNGPVRFTGCGLFGSRHGTAGTALARIAGRGRVSFSNCHFYCFDPKNRGEAVIRAEAGRLSVNGCVFLNSKVVEKVNCNPIPIVLEPDVISAVIMGNEFYGEARIDNRARGRTEIGMNVERTDEEPYPNPTE